MKVILYAFKNHRFRDKNDNYLEYNYFNHI